MNYKKFWSYILRNHDKTNINSQIPSFSHRSKSLFSSKFFPPARPRSIVPLPVSKSRSAWPFRPSHAGTSGHIPPRCGQATWQCRCPRNTTRRLIQQPARRRRQEAAISFKAHALQRQHSQPATNTDRQTDR